MVVRVCNIKSYVRGYVTVLGQGGQAGRQGYMM